MFGAIRPYKGVDIALDALAARRSRASTSASSSPVGRGTAATSCRPGPASAASTGGSRSATASFPNEEAALLFGAADASLLPYRSASQSGVVQLSFAYGCPVIATRVGGLPAAVDDGVNGILCEPDAADVAAAIERMAREHAPLAAGVPQPARRVFVPAILRALDEAVAALS